jgi:hypothetical protein
VIPALNARSFEVRCIWNGDLAQNLDVAVVIVVVVVVVVHLHFLVLLSSTSTVPISVRFGVPDLFRSILTRHV